MHIYVFCQVVLRYSKVNKMIVNMLYKHACEHDCEHDCEHAL